MRWLRFILFACFLSTAYAQNTPTDHAVFLTHRKAWLASGGFNADKESKTDRALPDYVKDFRKQCLKVAVTDIQNQAEYAVTIDEIGFVSSLTNPNAPTFQVAVYSRNAGLVYMGGTALLKNAIKDACNAIGTSK
jgi:hypothetical protein